MKCNETHKCKFNCHLCDKQYKTGGGEGNQLIFQHKSDTAGGNIKIKSPSKNTRRKLHSFGRAVVGGRDMEIN